MAKLYEIINEIENFDFDIDEDTGEILNASDLEQLQLDRDTKIENILLWIKNLKSDAEAYKNEKMAFADRQRRAEAKVESLKKYISYCLDGEKFNTDKVQATWRRSEAVELKEGASIIDVPTDYTLVDIKLNKKMIKNALKAGDEITGVELISKNNLIIK